MNYIVTCIKTIVGYSCFLTSAQTIKYSNIGLCRWVVQNALCKYWLLKVNWTRTQFTLNTFIYLKLGHFFSGSHTGTFPYMTFLRMQLCILHFLCNQKEINGYRASHISCLLSTSPIPTITAQLHKRTQTTSKANRCD